ncbi:uncharacterized protein LOC113312716 [Papaver somniferum]|uniref:uncharacterized protein LOC113312716 n=1 Tax=Papaver somniferum TaxID=3469 RepID=UPI000E6F465F|nr:uncharacterized protein LOC113312716 [Papaver somniferum]
MFRKNIDCLCDNNGVWFKDSEDIAKMHVNHFEQVSKTSNPKFTDITFDIIPTVITAQDNSQLNKIPSTDEIFQTIKNMNVWGSPGADGFQSGFYKYNWDIIGQDVTNDVQGFFGTGFMPTTFNKTYLSLIPKTDNATKPVDFRPISLWNTIYKVISKIMEDRIKPHLKHMISPYQAAFVPGRDIHDNIIVAHEMIHTMKHKAGHSGTMALKLDISKAFDRIEWPFFARNSYNFWLLLNAETNHQISGVKVARNAPADMHNIAGIMNNLNYFGSVSGQMLNLDKSNVYFSHNLSPSSREIIARELKMTKMKDSDTYLGVTLLIGRNKTKSFKPLIQFFGSRLKTWKGKTMNHSARTVMVKHVLNALPTYQMGCFRIPKTKIDQMDVIQKHFWWGHSSNRGLCLIGWNNIRILKSLGGLGFRNLEHFNTAMLTKLAWKASNDDNSLCMQIVRAKYGKNDSLLHLDKLKDDSSWLWKSIYSGIEVVQQYSMWIVQRGTKINIWLDNWIIGFNSPPVPIVGLSSMLSYTLVCDIFLSGTRIWNEQLICSIFNQETSSAILNMLIPSTGEDYLIWKPDRKGEELQNDYGNESSAIKLMCTVWYIWKDR